MQLEFYERTVPERRPTAMVWAFLSDLESCGGARDQLGWVSLIRAQFPTLPATNHLFQIHEFQYSFFHSQL